jgi:hypothetical protein
LHERGGYGGDLLPGLDDRNGSSPWAKARLALADTPGSLSRFVPLPGHRFATIGLAPLIGGIEFRALIADKAFDGNSLAAIVHLAASASRNTHRYRRRAAQMAATDQEFVLQSQAIQAHRDPQRQDGSKLRRHRLSLSRHHKLPMNLARS